MISDDLAPAVAWAPPTKKTTLFIARLGNQAINPVGKAHATIRSSITRPTYRPAEPTCQEKFLYLRGNCLLISDSRSSTIKHKKVV